MELAAGSTVVMISNSAHSAGANGTNWRIDLEVHNPTATMAGYTMAPLKRDTENSSPTTVSFVLSPGSSQRYTDVIDSVFGFYGAAAIQITITSGSLIVTSVTYNRMAAGNPGNFPDGSTFGQYVPAFTDDQAITFSNFQASSSSFSANYVFSTTSDFSLNGQRNAIPTANGTITAIRAASQMAAAGMGASAQSAVTTVVAATVIGSGTNPPATESGNIHVDTSKCAKFPVSGAINVTIGSDRYVIAPAVSWPQLLVRRIPSRSNL